MTSRQTLDQIKGVYQTYAFDMLYIQNYVQKMWTVLMMFTVYHLFRTQDITTSTTV